MTHRGGCNERVAGGSILALCVVVRQGGAMNVQIQTQPQRRQPLFIDAVYRIGEPGLFVTDGSADAIAYRHSPSVQGRQQRALAGRLDVP